MIKRSDGRWQQQVTIENENGRKVQKYFYGRTKAELARKLAEWKLAEPEHKSITFEKLAEDWRAWSESKLSPTTYKGYATAYRRAKDQLGKQKADAIKTSDIAKYMIDFSEKHKGEKTNKTQLYVIADIFQYGLNRGILESNPAKGLTVEKGLEKSKRKMPESEELKKIKNAPSSDIKLIAYLALYAGMRRGEMFALTWDDIDLESRTITINKAMYWADHIGIKDPKTEAGERVVPIPERLYNELINRERKTETVLPYMSQGSFYKRWENWCDEIGIKTTPHALRHGYATMIVEAGIDPTIAQKYLGHAQLATTTDIYREIRNRKTAADEKMQSIDIE